MILSPLALNASKYLLSFDFLVKRIKAFLFLRVLAIKECTFSAPPVW
jgi:hypothetical protein